MIGRAYRITAAAGNMNMRLTAQKLTAPIDVIHTTDTGICAGTLIMTLEGEMPVEQLAPGDRIVTRDGGVSVLAAVNAREAKVRPIVIKGGSLGHTRPELDMTVTPDTRIHIRDWRATVLFGAASANIEAHRLADGEFVAQQQSQVMRIFDLQFANDHIIYANGVEIVVAAS
jgi:hypothetical protein